jgi:hypothetical protein
VIQLGVAIYVNVITVYRVVHHFRNQFFSTRIEKFVVTCQSCKNAQMQNGRADIGMALLIVADQNGSGG